LSFGLCLKFTIFAARSAGLVAERLGSGLQNRVQRFESARDLSAKTESLVNQEVRFSVFTPLVDIPDHLSHQFQISVEIFNRLRF
jgi:hypothetical protein